MIEMFLGHLVGDFMLQPKSMAIKKSTNSWICTLHVVIYTATVCAFCRSLDPLFWLGVAVPHWIIDRFSLANVWAKLMKGRTFQDAWLSNDQFREFDIAFTAIVYTVVDATMHLLCLYAVMTLVL